MITRTTFILLLFGLWAGCRPPQAITVTFRGVVGGADFACGQSYTGLGQTHTKWTPADFRFYVSRVRLVDSTGHEVPLTLAEDPMWQQGGVALLDFEDKTGPCSAGTAQTNKIIRGQAPSGSYAGLRFDLGLPAEINHQDASVAAPPLNVSGMFWSWQAGYKFLRTEGATTGVPGGYNAHVGSAGCQRQHGAITCAYENRAQVALMGFDPRTGTVIADLAGLFEGVDLDHNTDGTAPGCMAEPMDPDCAPLFHNLGLPVGQESGPRSPQKFFRVQ